MISANTDDVRNTVAASERPIDAVAIAQRLGILDEWSAADTFRLVRAAVAEGKIRQAGRKRSIGGVVPVYTAGPKRALRRPLGRERGTMHG